jgi:hypothetical protein
MGPEGRPPARRQPLPGPAGSLTRQHEVWRRVAPGVLLLLLASCREIAPTVVGLGSPFPDLAPHTPEAVAAADPHLLRDELVADDPSRRQRALAGLWGGPSPPLEQLLVLHAQERGDRRRRLTDALVRVGLQKRLLRRDLYDLHLWQLLHGSELRSRVAYGNLLGLGPAILPWLTRDLEHAAPARAVLLRRLQDALRTPDPAAPPSLGGVQGRAR